MARKQRQFRAEFKLETVMEVFKGEKPIAQICRERDVTDSLSEDAVADASCGEFIRWSERIRQMGRPRKTVN